MKKLLFVLLFIPLMSFSQEITFDELMSINSTDSFKRVVIENGFEFQAIEDDIFIWYGFELTKTNEGDRATKWAMYNKGSGTLAQKNSISTFAQSLAIFKFVKKDILIKLEYNQIVSDIKSKCEYVKIDGKYATYNCSESSFNGTIGIMSENGAGYVRIKPPGNDLAIYQ